MKNECGQSSIEACIALTFIFVSMALVAVIFISVPVKAWLQYQAHEAAVCLLTTKTTEQCRVLFLQSSSHLLDPNKITKLKMRKNANTASVEGEWKSDWWPCCRVPFKEKIEVLF